ncbi:MAG: diguanylate cyclase [Thermotogae bacterium]|nr:diguanylate cyclase [Thermotogota bacterium]
MREKSRNDKERLKRVLNVIDTIQRSLITSVKIDVESIGQMAAEFLIELVDIDRAFGLLRKNDFFYTAFVAGKESEKIYGNIVDVMDVRKIFPKTNIWVSLKGEKLSKFPVPAGNVEFRDLICFSYNDNIEFVMGIDVINHKGYGGVSTNLNDDDRKIIDLIFTQISLAVKESLIKGRVNQLSRFDPATGFYARRYFIEELKKRYGDAMRYNRNFTLLTISLSEIDNISKKMGYTYTDEVIKIFSKRLKKELRKIDLIGKIDYSHFSVLMMESDSIQAREKFRKVYEHFTMDVKNMGLITTASRIRVGMASFPGDSPNIDELIGISKRYYLDFGSEEIQP